MSRRGSEKCLCECLGMTVDENREAGSRDADDVERYPCPRCQTQPGSPCRSRSGVVAASYHTG
ncbi:zinc finger domain-containing protein [Dactylosporangium sp. CA-052675]|uniref:zinc finger domain-containing protein n=1 Tax=Dactylosporangium sp. CA-052675 TaxID=3239927 RepID=UPI003D92BFC0